MLIPSWITTNYYKIRKIFPTNARLLRPILILLISLLVVFQFLSPISSKTKPTEKSTVPTSSPKYASEFTQKKSSLIRKEHLKLLINSDSVNLEHTSRVEQIGTMRIIHKEYSREIQKENATIFSLVRNSETMKMIKTAKNFERKFNKQFHYDWIFANDEPFTQDFMDMISNVCSGTTKFIQIPTEMWSYPDWIDLEKASEVRKEMAKKRIRYGDQESYRHMCRFFSGMLFRMDELLKYKYLWRIEPEVEFKCSIKYDPFQVMRTEDKIYGFTLSPLELHTTVKTLWTKTLNYMNIYPERISKNNNFMFLTDDNGISFNMCHFWSNFEIVDLGFFRSERYVHFFNYLDKQGGIYYERWGDAPIHTIAVSILIPFTKLHYFSNTGYFHAPNLQCDGSDQMLTENQCTCLRQDDFSWGSHSCIPKFFDIHGLERPKYAPKDRYLPIHDSKLREIEEQRIKSERENELEQLKEVSHDESEEISQYDAESIMGEHVSELPPIDEANPSRQKKTSKKKSST